MCIQAHYSIISQEKRCIKATLRANLSNEIESFPSGANYSIKAIYEIALFVGFFIFVA